MITGRGLEKLLQVTVKDSGNNLKIDNIQIIDRLLSYFEMESCNPSDTSGGSAQECSVDTPVAKTNETQ